jgi:LTXXQ motif family protein
MDARKLGLFAAILLGSTSFGHAQGLVQQRVASEAAELLKSDWRKEADQRVDVLKAALQLTPDQMKLWAPLDDALRARQDYRAERLQELANPPKDRKDVATAMQNRATNFEKRAANLKALATALQPFYASLDENQKKRLAVLSGIVFHEARDAVEERRSDLEDRIAALD